MRGQGSFSSFTALELPALLLPKDCSLKCGPSVCPSLLLLSEARPGQERSTAFSSKLALPGHELTIRWWILLVLPDICLLGSLVGTFCTFFLFFL